MPFELFIGARYLRARRKQSFISLITLLAITGVLVGVMALIVVIAVMTGFESDLKQRILGVESHLQLRRQGGGIEDYERITRLAETTPGVTAATPLIVGQIMIRSAAGVSGAILKGVDPAGADRVIQKLDSRRLLPETAARGDEDASAAVPGIILGKELAIHLGAAEGDIVYIISPGGMLAPIGHVPAMKRFRVVGRFESGIYDYDGSLVFVHLSDAQRVVRMPGAVNTIEMKVADIYQAGAVGERITTRLGGYPYWTRTWMQMNQALFSALKLEKTVMFIILTLIVLVAAFNIASSLIMMVMEKTKDIAILKAMGATDGSIRKIFVFKGMVIGAVGTSLGVLGGFVLCALLERYQFIELPGDVYYLTTLPVLLRTPDVVAIAAAALFICFLATLYPARQAARLNPVEALRYG